jgi:four helix bundle protein
MHNYKELMVWQNAIRLATEVYRHAEAFPREEKYGLVSQIQRSVLSIASNIAEGGGRNGEA